MRSFLASGLRASRCLSKVDGGTQRRFAGGALPETRATGPACLKTIS